MNDNSIYGDKACRSPSNLLITGGTGSLGQEVTKQVLEKLEYIDKVMIFSRDEQKQAQMQQKFNGVKNSYKLRFLIGDVRDKERLSFAVRDATSVIHAAALKIVPSIEYNPQECIKTNIIGSQNLIEACCQYPYHNRKVLAISTDKAVHPINLYGATKLAAEKLFIDANNLTQHTKFSVARYGNVTGSRGSVIPFFKECIRDNKPLPITDPNMTRFWITLTEAAKFVIRRLRFMEGREIFIPDMLSYRVSDLAEILIRDKFGPNKQYPSRIVGLRPGEKIHEDLVSNHEFNNVYPIEDGCEAIKPEINIDMVEAYKAVQQMGLPIKSSYNSSMFVMTQKVLEQHLIDDGIIDPPFDNIVREDEPNLEGHA